MPMAIYIQLGAGAGDLDYSADFRDGFSKLIKSKEINEADRILVVEANHFNIPTLTESWRAYPHVEIYNLAISTKQVGNPQKIDFFYAVDDGPYFQIASVIESHVRKYSPGSVVKSFSVAAEGINTFLKEKCGDQPIELLAIDIEGLDLEVIEELNLSKFDIHRISFEKSLDLPRKRSINKKLKSMGYRRAGSGMDPHNSDVMWVKPANTVDFLSITLRHLKHKLWEVQLPARHFIKTKVLNKKKFPKN
jgi:FkbM family methyltransferase